MGDCAILNSEFSSSHGRNWTSESSNPLDYVDTRDVNCPRHHPVRQPTSAPDANSPSLLDSDKGFAKFLKKHASPTHQRVTAGGHIVPMEPRINPPQFMMKRSTKPDDKLGTSSPAMGIETNQANARNGKFGSETSREPLMPNPAGFLGHQLVVNPFTGLVEPAMLLPPYGNGNLHPGLASSVYNQMSPSLGIESSHMPPHGLLPVQQLTYPTYFPYGFPATPLPAYYNAYPVSSTPMISPEYPAVAPNSPLADNPVNLPQILAQATLHFQTLDAQLKEHDRLRAMREYDPAMADQRRAIVDKRSSARETMDRLIAATDRKGQNLEKVPSSQEWNVQAPVYIPKSTEKLGRGLDTRDKLRTVAASPKRYSGVTVSADDSTEPYHNPHTSEISATQSTPGLDLRGSLNEERQGHYTNDEDRRLATRNLQLRVVNQSLGSQAGLGPVSFVNDRVPSAASRQTKSDGRLSMQNSLIWRNLHSTTSVNQSSYYGQSRAQQDRKKHLDALRLPRGVTTSIELHDNRHQIVDGVSLTRPVGTLLSDWERTYWDRVENKYSLETNSVSLHDKENSNTNSAFSHQFNLVEFEGARRTPVQPSLSIAKEAFPRFEDGMDRELGSGNRSTSSDPNSLESMMNKALSSVAVNSVPVIGSLPGTFDGALELAQRKLHEVVSSPGKIKSPRLLRRTAGGYRAWIGPYRRDHQVQSTQSEIEPHFSGPFRKGSV